MDALWPQHSNFLEYRILSSVLCLSVLCHKKADSFLRKYFSNTGISISPEEISLQDACSFHKKRKIQISNNTNNNEEEENGGDDDDDDDNNNEEDQNLSYMINSLCICVFSCQTLRNTIFEVLASFHFQKYNTCLVKLQILPKLYLCICVFVFVYLVTPHSHKTNIKKMPVRSL